MIKNDDWYIFYVWRIFQKGKTTVKLSFFSLCENLFDQGNKNSAIKMNPAMMREQF